MDKIDTVDLSAKLKELSQEVLSGKLKSSLKIDDLIKPFKAGVLSGVLEISVADPTLYMIIKQLVYIAYDVKTMSRAAKEITVDEKFKRLGTVATISEAKFIQEVFNLGQFGPCHKDYMLSVAAFHRYMKELKGL